MKPQAWFGCNFSKVSEMNQEPANVHINGSTQPPADPCRLDRHEIKAFVRYRDGYRCTECGMTDKDHFAKYGKKLDVHRLNPGAEYTVDGCITLCRVCYGPKPKSRRRPEESLPGRVPIAKLLSVKEAATAQHVSISTVTNWIRFGIKSVKLIAFRVGGCL